MLGYIQYLLQYLAIPTILVIVLIGILLILQVIGELLEFKGKIVPEFMKIRKYFARKKKERQAIHQMISLVEDLKQVPDALKNVQNLLNDVNIHYSEDNITKRDAWMSWVNDRAEVYDQSIIDIKTDLANHTKALESNTKMTEEMFVEGKRDRIIDFATKVSKPDCVVSREEFNRIIKVYNAYEKFLEEHKMTNGEVDIAYRIIQESYEHHMKNHSFVENIRGYDV